MNLVSTEYKEFQFADSRVVLDIQRNILFEVDEIACQILKALRKHSDGSVSELKQHFSQEELSETLDELREMELIHEDGQEPLASEVPHQLPAVSALCMNVIHNCNMHCSYCYADRGQYGTPGESMSYSTAKQAVEFLLEQVPPEGKGSIHLFGGEPLLAWDLLQKLIPYVRQRADEEGKRISISITTNGTLLTEDIIHFLCCYRVWIDISLDGPPDIHDRMRVLPDGSGSYHLIFPALRMLAEVQRPFSLRATLDPNEPRLLGVLEHLLGISTGFVHAEPASGMLGCTGGLSPQAVKKLKTEYGRLKERYIQAIKTEGNLLPIYAFVRKFSLLRGSRKQMYYGCGMGRTYLAVSPRGEFYPCHRFVGHKEYLLGDLGSGPSEEMRKQYVALHVHQRESCRECWARYFCGGGCYYKTAVTQIDMQKPDPADCELMKAIITESIEIATYLSQFPIEKLQELGEALEKAAAYRY